VDSQIPVIVLNAEQGAASNGFSWRFGIGRIEIFAASERGLCNGIYDFLAALGVKWPKSGGETLPPPHPDHPLEYPLKSASAYQPSVKDPAQRRRLVITRETPLKNRGALVIWAARNGIDALALPLWERQSIGRSAGKIRGNRESLMNLAKQYAMHVEAGGWDLAGLVPRRNFFFRREVFRMDEGKRIKQYNFCPTNPDTIGILKEEARRRFQYWIGAKTEIFHLWPDRGAEHTWCSCPSCRAFSREEQNRIAVNTAADILAEINPEAAISYYENTESANPADVSPRPNMFILQLLPGDEGAEKTGLFLA
jgi:hypothetical protein